MAEEFQGGICGGNWWATSSRHALVAASPCSVGFNDHMGMSFGCLNDLDMVDIKARTTSSGCGEIINNNTTISSVAVSVSDHHSSNNIGFDRQSHNTECASGSASNLIDSTLQMIGFGLSSSTAPSDFINQANLLISRSSGRGESNFHSMVNEDMGTKLNYEQETSRHDQIQKDWSPKSTFSGVVGADDDDKDSSIINGFKFKPMNQELSNFDRGSSNSSGFPISSSAMANSYGFPSSTLLQSLFESELVVPQTQQSLFNTHPMSYSSSADPNYGAPNNPNDLLLSPTTSSTSNWPRLYSPSSCLRPTSQLQPPKQQVPAGGSCGHGLHFSNNTPFWNASASTGLFPSASQSQYTAPAAFEHKPNSGHNFITKTNTNEHVQDSSSIVKKSGSSSSCEVPVFKRARIETPSPLPTFKVRKEKLGDRITALQQLVSPFGKTDTASVLHEAIEYIKFLHDQVSVLSTPYMKNGGLMQQQQQGITCDHNKMEAEGGGGKQQDLKSRGLCLVPISSTFPVATETTADFWTPTFGATFR